MNRKNKLYCLFSRISIITLFVAGFVFYDQGTIHAGGGDSWQKTVWSDKSELFMKYDPPVAGQIGGFLLQLTSLVNFKPISEGRVTLVLTSPDGRKVSQPMKFSGRPGIFNGTISPLQSGSHRFALQIAGAGYEDEIAYDGFTVRQKGEKISEEGHKSQAATDIPISFLKEQQWAVDFAVKLPEKRQIPTVITVSGEISANPNSEAVISAPLAGILAFDKPIAHLGQRLIKGEELCHIESPISQDGGAEQLAAQVAEARNRVLLAQKELDRSRRLVEGLAAPRKRLEEAEIMFKIAQSNLAPLQKALSRVQAGSYCGHTVIRSPINGTVVEANAANGSYLQAGQPIMKIVDTTRLWLKANVPVAETTHSEHLSSAYFTLAGIDAEFKPSRLVTVSDIVDSTTRTVQTIFEVDNPESRLKIGMFVTVFLQNGFDEGNMAVAVPISAVFEDEGKYFVYVQSGGETFVRREVTTGNRAFGFVAINSGISAAERIVVNGGYYVKQASQSSKTPEGHGHEH